MAGKIKIKLPDLKANKRRIWMLVFAVLLLVLVLMLSGILPGMLTGSFAGVGGTEIGGAAASVGSC